MRKGTQSQIDIRERDWQVLRGFFESRVMTLKHIAQLYFPGTKEMAKKRLQRLKAAGLVIARPRQTKADPEVLFLSHKAFKLLNDHGKVLDLPRLGIQDLVKRVNVSPLKLSHELEVMDVKAAFYAGIRKCRDLKIEEFSTWPELYRFESCDSTGRLVETQPDGFVRIHQRLADGGVKEHTFFIEVDRSTEGNAVLADRAHCYGTFYRDGGLAARNGRPREEYKQFFFRVLVTCKTTEKRNNLAAKLLLNSPPVHTQVWLSTIDEVRADAMGELWVRPVDYRDVTMNTPFNPYLQPKTSVYRRRSEREEFVERAIPKRALFTDAK